MKLPAYLHFSRHRIYYFRIRIPHAVKSLVRGNELRRSLMTADRVEAVRRARILAVKADSVFQRLHNMAREQGGTTSSKKVIYQWCDPLLNEIAFDRETGTPAGQVEGGRIGRELLCPSERSTARGERLSELIPKFLLATKQHKAAATYRKFEHTLRLVLELTGDRSADSLGQAVLADFKAKVMCLPKHAAAKRETRGRSATDMCLSDPAQRLSARTLNTHLRNVVSFSAWAHAHDEKVQKLTAEKLAIPIDTRADEERKAFDAKDLRSLLTGQRFEQLAQHEPHKCWLMLIALFTGARIEEICQLDPHTDLLKLDGMHVLDINDCEEKQVKNKASKRKIPVSETLVELGVIDYLQAVIRSGARKPFPQWKPYLDKKSGEIRYSKSASKWFGRYSDLCGISDPLKVFHSFRHTLLNHLKQSNVHEGIAAAIAGQTYGGITYARYGKAYPPEQLKSAMDAIAFDIRLARPALPHF